MQTYWDIKSVIFYLILSVFGWLCIYQAREKDKLSQPKILNRYYVIWFLVWTSVASFRYITKELGGQDAYSYVNYFHSCIEMFTSDEYTHYDILYRIFNIVIRIFTDNEIVFLFIFYGVLVYSYIIFVKEFWISKASLIPSILIFYIYLRGFNTFRTNLAVSVILIGLVLLYKKKNKYGYLFIISSFFIQKASILYILFIPFYILYHRKKVSFRKLVILVMCAYLVVGSVQQMLVYGKLGTLLGHAYSYYARISLSTSFFETFWKIAFEQLLLAGGMFVLRVDLEKDMKKLSEVDRNKMKFIWNLCIYDFLTIPIAYVLNIWRAYEYFYLPRLIMFGYIISVLYKKVTKDSRIIISCVSIILLIAWFIFRLYNTWEDSSLLPYMLRFWY